MSNTNPPPPPVGEYRLFDRVLGPLPAGNYKIEIEQGFDSEQGSVSKFFDVTGPRWGLEATEVHAVFPPRNEQNATTDSYVPFITLQRRSLPWERLLLLNGETPQISVHTIKCDIMMIGMILESIHGLHCWCLPKTN